MLLDFVIGTLITLLRKDNMRRVNLPRNVKVWNGKKEETLELQHIKNVVMYDFKLGNLLFNAIKAEKKAKQLEEDLKFNIPF